MKNIKSEHPAIINVYNYRPFSVAGPLAQNLDLGDRQNKRKPSQLQKKILGLDLQNNIILLPSTKDLGLDLRKEIKKKFKNDDYRSKLRFSCCSQTRPNFFLDLDSRPCFVKGLLTVYKSTVSLFFNDLLYINI